MNTTTTNHSFLSSTVPGRILVGAGLGVLIGTILELIFSSLVGGSLYTPGVPGFLTQFSNQNVAVLTERVIYALLGIIQVFAAKIYESERRPVAQSTLLHLALTFVTVAGAGIYLKWFTMSAGQVVSFVATFAIAYLLIWIYMWFQAKKAVQGLNDQLAKRNK